MQFSHTYGRRLPHVWVLVLEALAEWLTQVLSDLVNPDTPHGSDSQGPDQGVWVLTVLVWNRIVEPG